MDSILCILHEEEGMIFFRNGKFEEIDHVFIFPVLVYIFINDNKSEG
jgi:hypothetical protein